MKENVLDVLMFLFEKYFYDEPEGQPDRADMEENLHQAGFTVAEIEKAFQWLDGLAEQRHQPELKLQLRFCYISNDCFNQNHTYQLLTFTVISTNPIST